MAEDCKKCGLSPPCDCDDGGDFGKPAGGGGGGGGDGGDGDFTLDERQYVKKLFESFDTDKSGKIDFMEFKILARKLGVEMKDDELRASMKAINPTGDELGFEELLKWLQSAQSGGADSFAMLKVKIKAQGKKALTNNQIEGLRDCFNHFDKDNSGSIDIAELGDVFTAFGQEMSKDELDQMMQEVDGDGSGEMEFDEFLMLMISNFGEEAGAEQELVEEFQKRDTERTGKITIGTLKELMGEVCGEHLTQEDIDKIAGSLQTSDGMIEYMKWEELWEALHE